MAQDVGLLLMTLRIVIVVLGITFLVVAWRASQRTRSRSLLVLSGAVTLLTASMVWEPIATRWVGWTEQAAHVGEAFLMAGSLMLLVYSLIVPERQPVRRPESEE